MADTVPIPGLSGDEAFIYHIVASAPTLNERLERLENLYQRDEITSHEMLHIRRALERGASS